MQQIRIAVGSTSAHKIQAVELACPKNFLLEIVSESAKSGVNPMPIGYTEILQGATNRAREAQKVHPGAFGLGIENGLAPKDGHVDDEVWWQTHQHHVQWFDVAHIVLIFPDGTKEMETSDTLPVPTEIMLEIFRHSFQKTSGEIAVKMFGGGDPTDLHFILSGGKVHRVDFLIPPLKRILQNISP